MIRDYGKIVALGKGHSKETELLNNPHYAEEKIDGSQISFGVFDGRLIIRSRNRELSLDAPDGLFKLAVEHIKSVKDRLHPGWTYRGECVTKLRHNVVTYQRLPKGFVAIWEIETDIGETFEASMRVPEAFRLGFEPVWTMPQGDYEASGESMLGGPREGIVIKSLHRHETPTGKLFYLRRKKISAEYSEKNGMKKHVVKGTQATIEISDTVSYLAKTDILEHSYQRTKEKMGRAPQIENIGLFLKELAVDMEEEYKDEIGRHLYKAAEKSVRKGLNRVAVEWLKGKL